MVNNPCRYCTTETGRSPTCHASCEKYANFRIEKDMENEELAKQKRQAQLFAVRTYALHDLHNNTLKKHKRKYYPSER